MVHELSFANQIQLNSYFFHLPITLFEYHEFFCMDYAMDIWLDGMNI